MAWKNLLVNGKNNITARTNAMANIQNTMANRTTATNVNTTPNLPTPTANVTLRKAAQPVQTPIVQNNAMNNLNTKIVQPVQTNTTAGGVWTVAPIQQQQSRFIGLQKQPTWKSMANLTKSALYIPTAWGTAWKANKKEENKFRTTEQALLDFQADVLKKKGKMKDADIKRLYPEFADRLDVMKELQTELRPIVKNWQWVDGEQLAQYYPELIQPKNLQDVEAIKKQSDTSNKKLQSNIQKVEKVVTENFDVLSPDWQKYVQDYLTLAWVIDSLKKNYRIVWGANDDEILQYAIENNPQLKWVADELQRLTLSEMDKATIDWNSQSIITSMISGLQKMTRQASNAVQNFAAEQNYLAEQSWTNQPNVFNTTWNTAANILWAADQATTATARFFWNQNVQYELWNKEAQEAVEKQEISDMLAMWWWALKTIWWVATAPFEYWKLNPITKPIVEEWIEPFFELVSDAEQTIAHPVWDVLWFNEQDKENADAILLWEIFRETKNVKKDVKVRAEAAKDIVSDAFKRTVKSNKRSEMKKEFQKAWVYDEAWYIKPEARTQAAKIIAKEFAKDFTENFKNDAKQWWDVVDFYRKKEWVKSYKEQVQEFKEWAKNVVDSVKETGKNVWKKIETWIDKGFDKMDESIEKGIDNLRNKVTKGKTTEIKAEETAPIKDTAWWSQPKKWVVSKVVWWVTAVWNKINEKVVDPLSTKVAEWITSTTAPQDKLFKALNPSINVLSRKKWNYDTIRKNADRANELIVEYGDAPTNSKDYYDSIVNTKKKIWNNWIQQGLDEYKYTTIDAKDLINPVREALKEFTAEPLEALKGDVKKLEAELQAIESKGIISLLEMETKKRQINAILEYWLPPDASQIYEKWMRELNRQIWIQEDRMISELPWEFSKFKRDYGALTAIEEDAQKLMIKDMKKKLWGNLIQNWSRIEGLGKMGKAMVWNGSFLEWAAQIILWESLGKVKDTNFLIKSWFEGLKQQYKWGTTKPEWVKIKKKPPTPKLEDKRTDVEKWKLLEIDKRTKSNREEWYKTKNAVTSEKSAVTEKKPTQKKEEVVEKKETPKAEKELETRVEKQEPKKDNYIEEFKKKTDEYFKPIYWTNARRVEELLREDIVGKLYDAGYDDSDFEIVDLALTGSRTRWYERSDSDLDIVVQFKGDWLNENQLFNDLNTDKIDFYWIEVDVNPILWDLAKELERQEKYMQKAKEEKTKQKETKVSQPKNNVTAEKTAVTQPKKEEISYKDIDIGNTSKTRLWKIIKESQWDYSIQKVNDNEYQAHYQVDRSTTPYLPVIENKIVDLTVDEAKLLQRIQEDVNSMELVEDTKVSEQPKNAITAQKTAVTTPKESEWIRTFEQDWKLASSDDLVEKLKSKELWRFQKFEDWKAVLWLVNNFNESVISVADGDWQTAVQAYIMRDDKGEKLHFQLWESTTKESERIFNKILQDLKIGYIVWHKDDWTPTVLYKKTWHTDDMKYWRSFNGVALSKDYRLWDTDFTIQRNAAEQEAYNKKIEENRAENQKWREEQAEKERIEKEKIAKKEQELAEKRKGLQEFLDEQYENNLPKAKAKSELTKLNKDADRNSEIAYYEWFPENYDNMEIWELLDILWNLDKWEIREVREHGDTYSYWFELNRRQNEKWRWTNDYRTHLSKYEKNYLDYRMGQKRVEADLAEEERDMKEHPENYDEELVESLFRSWGMGTRTPKQETYEWLPVEQDEWGKFVRKSVEWLPPIKQYIWQWEIKSEWNNVADTLNNLKSFEDLGKIFELREPTKDENIYPYYHGILNEVPVMVRDTWDSIHIRYWSKWESDSENRPTFRWAKARVDKFDKDYMQQLSELLREVNNSWEILESNRYPSKPQTTTEITWEKTAVTAKTTESTEPKNKITKQDIRDERIKNLISKNWKLEFDWEYYTYRYPWSSLYTAEWNPIMEWEEVKMLSQEQGNQILESQVEKALDNWLIITLAGGDELNWQIFDHIEFTDWDKNFGTEPWIEFYRTEKHGDGDEYVWIMSVKNFLNKYWKEIQDLQSVAKSENRNIIGKNNSLTTKNPTNDRNNETDIGKKDEWQTELSNSMTTAKANDWGRTRPVDQWAWTSWEKSVSASSNNISEHRAWLENGASSEWVRKSIRTKWDDVITEKTVTQARDINRDCVDILEKHEFSSNPADYTKEEIETLKQYEGRGGINDKEDSKTQGALNQYYTKDNIIKAMWRLLDWYSNTDILEPSMWVGRFFMYAPEWSNLAGFEYDKIPWTIAKILYPNADIKIWDFQDNFMLGNLSMWDNYRGKKYDIVIWNPPYEERQGRQKALGEEPKISRFDDYFIKRGVDMLKPWGHLAFVTSSQFLRGADNYAKGKISENAELIDAYRIPVGAFDRTGVETDIIVLRKKEWGGDRTLLSASKWFDEHPEKILGEERDDVMWRFWPKKAVVGDLWAIDEIAKTRTWTDWQPATLKSEFTPMEKVKDTKTDKPVTAKTIEAKEEKKTAPVKKFSDKDWVDWTEVQENDDGTTETVTWWKSLNWVIFKGKGWPTGRMTVGKWWVGKYQKLLNANWKIWDPTITLESDREWLNYIAWELEPNILYASWQIPKKLEQLEKDYEWGFIDEKQYNKQRDLLEQAMPEEIEYQNIYFSPYLDWIMDFPTNEIKSVWRGGKMVDGKATVRNLFEKYVNEKMDSYAPVVYEKKTKTGTETVTAKAGLVMIDIVGNKWKGYPTEAKEKVMTLLPKEFNNFLKWSQLDTDTKARLQTEYNKKYNSYANFDYSDLWYTVDDIAPTFKWDTFNISDVQARGISRILTTESMIIAHGVGQWKTIEWIIGAVASMQQWKARKALVVVPAWTKADRMQTTAQLFPNQEMVDLGSLAKGTGIRKKLVDMYWPDPRDWIQDWQLVFLEHSAIWRQISFKNDTLAELEQNLTDVMDSHFEVEKNIDEAKKNLEKKDKEIERLREKWASAADLEKKQKAREELIWDIQKMWRTTENTLQDILNTYADKWLPEDWIGKALELIDEDYDAFMNDMWEYLDNEINVGQAKINKADALKVAQDIFNNERAIYMEDLWIDHLTVDEAHNFRNLFNKAIQDDDDGGSYHAGMQTKEWSKQAKNLYAMSQYVMSKNGGGNVILLTATPFINDPSEMYNMLSYVGKNGMMEMWVTSMDDFYDNFVWLENKLSPTASTSWVAYKNVMIWFNNTETLVKNLLDRYIDYEWESWKVVKPRLVTNITRLKMSDTQAQIQKKLEEQIDKNEFDDTWEWVTVKERKLNDRWEAKWAVLEWMTQANLNLISPYLTKYLKDQLGKLTWQDLIESSPKLKMVVKATKLLRDMWIMRWVFVYMDKWKELHEKLKKAIEESIPWIRVWIINWDKKYADLSAAEAAKLWIEPEWAKARQTAKKFSNGELDVLIWWENTKEWLNLQGNGYLLLEVSQPRNANDRIQLNGRMWRNWNKSNEVLDTLLLMENSSDIYRFELMSRKESRWNILEQLSAYKKWEKIEDVKVEGQLDMNEEKLALFTDPEKKAKVSIVMEKAALEEQKAQTKWQIASIEKLVNLMSDWKNDYWRYRKLGEWVTRMDKLKDEDGKAITTDILADNALEPLEQQVDYAWNEAMKNMQEYNERRTEKWTKAEMEKNIKNNSPYTYEATQWRNLKDKLQQARSERNLVIRQTESLWINTIEWLSDFILELEQQLRGIESKLTDVESTFNDKVAMFKAQAEANKANEMDMDTMLEDLKEDFKHQVTLSSKDELKNWLEVTKNLPKREQARNKAAVTWGKNKYTWNAKDYVWKKATFEKPKNLITSKYEAYSESNPKPEIKYIWYTPKEIIKTKDWNTLTRIWYQDQFQKMNNTLKAIKKKVVDTEEQKSYWRRDDVNEILWQNDYYNGLKTRLSNMILKFAQRYDTEIIKAYKSDNPWKTPTWPEDFYNYINNYNAVPVNMNLWTESKEWLQYSETKVEDEYVKAWAEHLFKVYNGNKNNVIANDKNKVTTQAARTSRPSIRMNVEEREKKTSKNVVVNPDWKQVPTNNESKNWKKVVVDSKWKAYSFYHGTPNWWFEEFDMNSRGSANDLSSFGDFGKWFYFTPDRQEAINYATLNNKVEWKNPEVYEVKLYMNNPLDFRKYYDGKREIEAVYRKSVNRNWNYLGSLNEEEQAELDKVLNKYWFKDEEERDDFADLIDSLWDNWGDWDMSAHGYDGVIWVNGHGEERVVFDKNQIEIIKHEKQQLKNGATSNDKNRVTNNAARAYSPTIVMRLDENGNPIKKNKVTSKKPTQNAPMKFSPELVEKVDKLAEERGLEWNTIKKMKVLNKEVDKWKWYQTETEKEIYNLKKQIIIEYVKSKWRTIKDKWQKKTIVDIKQWKTRVHWHVVGKLYRDLKKEWIIK